MAPSDRDGHTCADHVAACAPGERKVLEQPVDDRRSPLRVGELLDGDALRLRRLLHDLLVDELVAEPVGNYPADVAATGAEEP